MPSTRLRYLYSRRLEHSTIHREAHPIRSEGFPPNYLLGSLNCQSLSKLSVYAPSPRLAFMMGPHPLGWHPVFSSSTLCPHPTIITSHTVTTDQPTSWTPIEDDSTHAQRPLACIPPRDHLQVVRTAITSHPNLCPSHCRASPNRLSTLSLNHINSYAY